MTLQEAIKIKEIHSATGEFIDHSDLAQADRLVIEAAKRLQIFHQYNAYGHRILLPGEARE